MCVVWCGAWCAAGVLRLLVVVAVLRLGRRRLRPSGACWFTVLVWVCACLGRYGWPWVCCAGVALGRLRRLPAVVVSFPLVRV